MAIYNKEGDNLLDSNAAHTINPEAVNLYGMENGKKLKVSSLFRKPTLRWAGNKTPAMLRIYIDTNRDEDVIAERNGDKIGRTLTFVELFPGDMDTLETQWKFTEKEGSKITKTYFNDELVYDLENMLIALENENSFILVK